MTQTRYRVSASNISACQDRYYIIIDTSFASLKWFYITHIFTHFLMLCNILFMHLIQYCHIFLLFLINIMVIVNPDRNAWCFTLPCSTRCKYGQNYTTNFPIVVSLKSRYQSKPTCSPPLAPPDQTLELLENAFPLITDTALKHTPISYLPNHQDKAYFYFARTNLIATFTSKCVSMCRLIV